MCRTVRYFSAILLLSFCGCHTWNMGQPFTGVSRVPPPATGSYPTTNQYYNQPALGTANTQPVNQPVMTAASTGLRKAGGSLPTTNLTNLNNQGFADRNQGTSVVPASGFTTSSTNSVMPAAATISDSSSVPPIDTGTMEPSSNLQWQP